MPLFLFLTWIPEKYDMERYLALPLEPLAEEGVEPLVVRREERAEQSESGLRDWFRVLRCARAMGQMVRVSGRASGVSPD